MIRTISVILPETCEDVRGFLIGTLLETFVRSQRAIEIIRSKEFIQQDCYLLTTGFGQLLEENFGLTLYCRFMNQGI